MPSHFNKHKSDNVLQKINNFKSKKTNVMGLNIAIELVASMFVGIIVGLMLDNFFTTRPIFLIICLILSNIAAFRLIWQKYIIKKDKNHGR